MDKIEIFDLEIDREDEESGVDFIALVDHPAIESNWLAFNKIKQRFNIDDEEKRIVSGYAMIADLPIPRIDEAGEKFYVKFREDVIRDIVYKFFENQHTSNINEMHDPRKVVDGVFVFESILIDSKRGTKAPSNFEEVPDGSWWVSMRVENDEVWEKIKAGEFQGFSVEGMFNQPKGKLTEEEIIERVREVIKNHRE